MSTSLCTTCGDPVLVADNGRVLTTAPVELGLFDPVDGEALTRSQIRERVRDTGSPDMPRTAAQPVRALFDTREAG